MSILLIVYWSALTFVAALAVFVAYRMITAFQQERREKAERQQKKALKKFENYLATLSDKQCVLLQRFMQTKHSEEELDEFINSKRFLNAGKKPEEKLSTGTKIALGIVAAIALFFGIKYLARSNSPTLASSSGWDTSHLDVLDGWEDDFMPNWENDL